MKAVILEIKNGYAAVLTDDGCIIKVKSNNYIIGQTLQINNPRTQLRKKVSMIAAAAAAAIIVIGTGTWSYASPYSYVSLDVNPSIEYTVNRFDRVIKVTGVNDDGEKIIENLTLGSLKNKTIESAVTATVDQISDAGYFDGVTKGGIVITTSGKNNKTAKELSEKLKSTVETEATKNNDDIAVEACEVAMDRVENAHKLGVTPGKLNLVEKLKNSASDPSEINIKEWLNKPVKDIMKATKDNKKSSMKSSSSENDNINKTAYPQDTYNSVESNSIDKTSDPQDTNNPVENDTILKNQDSAKKTAGKTEQKQQAYDKVKKEISNKTDEAVENNVTANTNNNSKKNKNTSNSASSKATVSSRNKDNNSQISEGKVTPKKADNSAVSQNDNEKKQSGQSQIDKPNSSSEAQSDKQNETQKENNNTEQKGNSNKSEVKPSDEHSGNSDQQSNANESSGKSDNASTNASSDNGGNSAGNSNSSAGNSNNSTGKNDNGNDNSRGKGNN